MAWCPAVVKIVQPDGRVVVKVHEGDDLDHLGDLEALVDGARGCLSVRHRLDGEAEGADHGVDADHVSLHVHRHRPQPADGTHGELDVPPAPAHARAGGGERAHRGRATPRAATQHDAAWGERTARACGRAAAGAAVTSNLGK